MESINSMRPPPVQPQSSSTLQQKRPRTPTLSLLMPSPQSMTENSSRITEVGSTSQEQIQKSAYKAWSEGAKSHLFQWLDLLVNYEKWKCVGIKISTRSTKTSGLSKKAITKIISKYLKTFQTKKTLEQGLGGGGALPCKFCIHLR